jgi:hypothetical protein
MNALMTRAARWLTPLGAALSREFERTVAAERFSISRRTIGTNEDFQPSVYRMVSSHRFLEVVIALRYF